MRYVTFVLALVCAIVGALPLSGAEPTPESGDGESRYLARVRQLTFEGRRAGEGYFSPSGERMVFQSERDSENPFFQIFELDLTDGESRLLSPGKGKTTCAFVRPGSGEVLFASTHHDPRSEEYQQAELDFRASGKERRYDWDFDPEMELYVTAGPEGGWRRLTDTAGYDAEASYSPDGPADRAGLKGGDIIVEFAGRPITNIYDYTYALDAVKVDDEVGVVYIRDGIRGETTIVPTHRP